MIIYVDGKPIFVKKNQTGTSPQFNELNKSNILIDDNKDLRLTSSSTNSKKAVAKIPYLLAAAAVTSNRQSNSKQIQKNTNSKLIAETKVPIQESNNRLDQDYLQIVSMLKQKNEKLINPLTL